MADFNELYDLIDYYREASNSNDIGNAVYDQLAEIEGICEEVQESLNAASYCVREKSFVDGRQYLKDARNGIHRLEVISENILSGKYDFFDNIFMRFYKKMLAFLSKVSASILSLKARIDDFIAGKTGSDNAKKMSQIHQIRSDNLRNEADFLKKSAYSPKAMRSIIKRDISVINRNIDMIERRLVEAEADFKRFQEKRKIAEKEMRKIERKEKIDDALDKIKTALPGGGAKESTNDDLALAIYESEHYGDITEQERDYLLSRI